jgi:hypothetical protein
MLPKTLYRHVLPALLVGLALRLFLIWRYSFASGDTPYYEELARNWLYHGVYGFFSNGNLYPSDARMPGYPGFLALIYSVAGPGRTAVFLTQSLVDLASCILAACIAARLAAEANERLRGRLTVAALWLAVLCPFTANYTAVPLTEVFATFLTTLAMLIFLHPISFELDSGRRAREILRSVGLWLLGGIVVGLGTLVRPETPLLLVAVLLFYGLRSWRSASWGKLALATLWMTVGVMLVLTPWAARNARQLGRVQYLAPRYAETYGEVMPTGFYAWTKTWMFRFRDAYRFTWKLPSTRIAASDVPGYGFDSADEQNRVTVLLEQYNRERSMSARTDGEFAQLAAERTRRHPLRSYVWVPIERAGAMWLTPRMALLPYSGKLWPLTEAWNDGPSGFGITLGFGILNCFYTGIGLLGVMYWRQSPGISLILAFIVVRTAFLTQMQTCEPRYVVECFPGLLALGAQAWRSVPSTIQKLAELVFWHRHKIPS